MDRRSGETIVALDAEIQRLRSARSLLKGDVLLNVEGVLPAEARQTDLHRNVLLLLKQERRLRRLRGGAGEAKKGVAR